MKAPAQPQTQRPRVTPLTTRGGLLQRRCSCEDAPDRPGLCESRGTECAVTAPASHDFAAVRVQAKLTVSQPGDPYEQEADQVAESVMRSLDDLQQEEPTEEEIGSHPAGAISPTLQRQTDSENEDIDEADDAAIQTKRSSDSHAPLVDEPEAQNEFIRELSGARLGGELLSDPLRGTLERAFAADFSQVRVHNDRESSALSRAVRATAFTHNTHIFFGAGRYEPSSTNGRRLLAHELTHVLQQNPKLQLRHRLGRQVAPTRSAGSSDHARTARHPTVQRQVSAAPNEPLLVQRDQASDQGKPIVIGELYFFGDDGKPIYSTTVFRDIPDIEVGNYAATLEGNLGNLKIRFGGRELSVVNVSDPKAFASARRRSRQLYLLVADEHRLGSGPKFSNREAHDQKPGSKTVKTGAPPVGAVRPPTGQVRPPDQQKSKVDDAEDFDDDSDEKAQTGDDKSAADGGDDPTDAPPSPGKGPAGPPPVDDKQPPSTEPPTGPAKSGKPGGNRPPPDTPDDGTDKRETDRPLGGIGGGKGQGTGPGKEGHHGAPGASADDHKTGSKYGWLGLLGDLIPQDVIDVLDGALDILDDTGEWQSLALLLQNLKEFHNYIGELRTWFDDPDKLLDVVLGLEQSDIINDLGKWAMTQPPKVQAKSGGKGSGLQAILAKLQTILSAIRRILGPVFKTRQLFLTAFEGVSLILDELPVVQELLGEGAESGATARTALVDKLSGDFSHALHLKMSGARGAFSGYIVKLEESVLIKYEDLARAIVDATKGLVPKPYKPLVWIAEKAGLDDAVADNVVAPLIPKDVLEAINDVLRLVFKAVEPVVDEVKKGIDVVLNGVEKGLDDYLLPEIQKIFAQPVDGAPRNGSLPESQARLFESISASHGVAMSSDLQLDMESRFGFDFGSVRIHADPSAHKASDMLRANAFAIGSDVFFGAGRFQPGSVTGQRLIAHELTHVLQQGEGRQTGIIQRDAKSILDKLVVKYGERVRRALQGSFKPSPKKAAEAAKMQAAADKLIGEPINKVAGKLPAAYSLVRSNKKIIGVRRKFAWMQLVYPLTVINNKLRYGFERSGDPLAAAARKKLRKALGCSPTQEAHHVVPLELRNDPLVKLAESKGFDFNGKENGVCLSDKIHSGSHPIYTGEFAGNLIGVREQNKGKSPDEVVSDFKEFVKVRQKDLLAGRRKLE